MSGHRISFLLTLSKELRNKGMEDEMKIIYECTLEWIPTLIVHCSSNEASHVRISACFVCGLYLNYTIRTIAHPLVSYTDLRETY